MITGRWSGTVLLLWTWLAGLAAICPNSCSGHGKCGMENVCSCYEGWTGGAPDCSWRSCLKGTAWADRTQATDSAHQLAECSNAGLCDRQTGMCKCFEGFTGSACQRSACPNRCSGHGSCSTISEASLFKGADYDSRARLYLEYYGDGYGVTYRNWDKDSIQLCECEDGFFGPDCSLVMCPKGDDPLTVNQNYRSIRFTVTSTNRLAGTLGLQFQGTSVFLPMLNYTDGDCSAEVSQQGKFGQVTCTSEYLNYRQRAFSLTFLSWPAFPRDNNLYANNGNPSKYDFHCNTAFLTLLTLCEFEDEQAEDIREYAYCSLRGKCDHRTGLCACLPGYSGPACGSATYLYAAGARSLPLRAVNLNALNFTSSGVRLSSAKSKAADFSFIAALSGSEKVFEVRGDGVVAMASLLTTRGGQTVSGGGFHIRGGARLRNEGVDVTGSELLPESVRVSSTAVRTASGYAAISINISSGQSYNNFLLKAVRHGQVKLRIRADGMTAIRFGGLHVGGAEGVRIGSTGLRLTGGATVEDRGVRVAAMGAAVTGGVTVHDGGAVVRQGGAQLFGGASVTSAGIKVVGGATVHTLGLLVPGGVTVGTLGLRLSSGGLTVRSGGLTATKGMTAADSGLRVSLGGLSVRSGGLAVVDGLTVSSGGARVTGGLTVAALGVGVSGGLVVGSGGGQVLLGGVYLPISGVTVSGGATFEQGFVVQTGSVTFNDGATVAGGMSIASANAFAGMAVNGGITVNGALQVSGGITTDTLLVDSVVGIQGTASIDSLLIPGSLTVYGVPMLSFPIQYSDRRLKTNLAPITGALDKVSRLQGLYFNWVADEVSGMRMDRQRHLGVLAQDLLRVVPEVVQQQERQGAGQGQGLGGPAQGRYLSVDYPALIPLLIEAIRDLQAIVNDVKDKQQLVNVTMSAEEQELVKGVEEIRKRNQDLRGIIARLRARIITTR